MPARVLIVDPDPIVADAIADVLRAAGHRPATAHDASQALDALDDAGQQPDPGAAFGAIVTEMDLPRTRGADFLKRLKQVASGVVPVAVARFGRIDDAVECVRLGAADYLVKPIVDDELTLAVDRALSQHALLAENTALKQQLSERYGLGSLVGSDFRMQKVYDLVEAVADSKTTALITGESGTGKTMVARAIHTLSPRASGPFVTFSCGAIPEALLESELFGHVKGAFTGADYDKPGKARAAHGGTLFIDEINSATPALQLKLLRVLQEKAFEPVGSSQTVHVDVRFVLATNQPLKAMVESGMFREDLFYRINVVSIPLPPLRDRTGDVALLAEHFVAKHCKEIGRERRLSEAALDALRGYDWPGNVRELENAIERAVVLSRGPTIEVEDLPETIAERALGHAIGPINGHRNGHGHGGANGHAHPGGAASGGSEASGGGASGGGGIRIPALAGGWTPTPLEAALKEPERQIILAALEANDWNRSRTADELEINRTTLYKKIKRYGLDGPR